MSMQVNIIAGRRHQGEGIAGEEVRLHRLNEAGLIVCGAVPRSKSKAYRIAREEFLSGAVFPACPACRQSIEKERS